MTFNERDENMINFGRFTVYQSLMEMVTEKDDINKINFDGMIAETMRNINDIVLLKLIDDVIKEGIGDVNTKDWREEMK